MLDLCVIFQFLDLTHFWMGSIACRLNVSLGKPSKIQIHGVKMTFPEMFCSKSPSVPPLSSPLGASQISSVTVIRPLFPVTPR